MSGTYWASVGGPISAGFGRPGTVCTVASNRECREQVRARLVGLTNRVEALGGSISIVTRGAMATPGATRAAGYAEPGLVRTRTAA